MKILCWVTAFVLIIMAGAIIILPRFSAREISAIQSVPDTPAYQKKLREQMTEFKQLEKRMEKLKKETPVNDELIDALTRSQRNIIFWMKLDAAEIPGNVPRDVQIFLSGR